MNLPWLTILSLLPDRRVARGDARCPRRVLGQAPKQIALGFSLVTLALGVALAARLRRRRRHAVHRGPRLDQAVRRALRARPRRHRPDPGAAHRDPHPGRDAGVVERRRARRWGAKGFFAWILALEGLSIGVFAATDVFLFYVFFEATLIPVYFLVAGYGGPDRVRAAVKFLLFSLAGGLIMLASVIGLYVESSKTEGGPTYLISRARRHGLRHLGRSLDVPRLLHRLRDQGADVPGAHLAPGHHRERHPGHLGAAGQRARQDRHLRDDPVLPRALPGGVALGHAGRRGARRHQHPVRRVHGDRLAATSRG